jgi:protein phosphatase
MSRASTAAVTRQPLWTDKRTERGPFDIIGDIHGCASELESLLAKLGYRISWSNEGGRRTVTVDAPHHRKAVFAGDFVDRGPNSPDVLRIVMSMTAAGTAYAVQGNHDRKLERWLLGQKVTVSHGLQQTIDQLSGEPRDFRDSLAPFLEGASQSRLARRRTTCGGACRPERGDDWSRLGRGAGVCVVRRDHRRD